ncbi:hypothetical protein NESM_000786600 [Novymonas esmeraldas]|uniref:Uncharacterized protein n=1 Tax=Novymonas esmeraldas TaxID=1808958 RepID=A0AAW0EXQ8_9TRYP
MLRRSTVRVVFMSPVDLYALDQRGSMLSYTQYGDASALTRSYQRCSPAERLRYAERAEALNDEVARTARLEKHALLHTDTDVAMHSGSSSSSSSIQ